MNRIYSYLLIYIFILPATTFGQAVFESDGKPLAPLEQAYEYSGHKYIAAVPFLKSLGFETFWNERSNKLVFKNEFGAGVISPLSPYVIFEAKSHRMQAAPIFIGGALCVPVEFGTGALFKLAGNKITLVGFTPKPVPTALGMPYRPLFLKKIVLDAGHGGHDSGAKSPSGLKEKDVVLAITLKLAKRLREEMGIEVVLTRSDDTFITLGNRARITNTSGADIFVSIHANGAFNNTATGTETFFLSFEASDRKAARMAAAENASIKFEQGNPLLDSGMDDLKKILWDMVRTEVLKDSEKLAIAVQGKLEKQLMLPSRGVKQAPFYVLMGSSIPAILVEVGFVTTSDEAAMLANPKFQDRIVSALFSALLHYDTVRATEIGR